MSEHSEGAASVSVVGAMAAIVAVLTAIVLAGGVALTQARLSGAADLAALAAAAADRDARVRGSADHNALATACAVALSVAQRNQATLSACERGPSRSVIITVSATPAGWPRAVSAASRAGSRAP